jgi:hypothetical protein
MREIDYLPDFGAQRLFDKIATEKRPVLREE